MIKSRANAAAADAGHRWMTVPKPGPMPGSAATGMAPVNGIRMYFATYGRPDTGAMPVLLIHGGLGHADLWSALVADLSSDRYVIVADSRGHGRSTRTAEPFGYDLLASDYVALLDYLKIDKVDLVGWSDGGIIGLDIAMKHPERLNRLFAHAANITVGGVDPAVATNAVFSACITWMGEDYVRMSPDSRTSSMPSSRRYPKCGRPNRTGLMPTWPGSPSPQLSCWATMTRRSPARIPTIWPRSFRARK